MAERTHRFLVLSVLRCWISLLGFTGVCAAVQVSVRDSRRFALLFQPVVLQCRYSSVSTQTPVVQWWFKSFCRDRARDSFRFPQAPPVRTHTLTHSELEHEPSGQRDCGDSGRTVRIVASSQGPAYTLAEHYRGRDIAIINKADLRIGELQWGDSGVYYCKVVISDDLEGQNEDHVELLVLEWVFVCAVVLGSCLLLLLVGVCWCQCCPHSCCCYVRCCCCPDTCCCPRHLYEAGKGIKSAVPTPVPIFPPYYIPGMPTMVPITPPSLIEPYLSSAASMDNGSAVRSGFHLQPVPDHSSLKMLQYVEKQLAEFNPSHTPSSCADSGAVSELSSLHHAEADFRQSYRHVQKKALPALPDLSDPADLRKLDLSPAREGRYLHQHRTQENPRWNPRSEHLQRKVCVERRRSGSVELEEFALGYTPRGRRHTPQGEHTQEENGEQERQRERELDQYTLHSSKHQSPNISPARRLPTPPPVPGERPECWEPGVRDQRALGSRLLERKTNTALSGSPSAGRTEDSDPNSRKSSERLQNSRNRPPCQRTEDSGDKHTHLSGDKHTHLSRDQHTHLSTPQEQNRPRKVSTLLSRDSLVV